MKTLAKALAIAAGLMFLLPFGFYLFGDTTYDFTQYATFVGGTAGPMAALAGFLFIYLTFQHQQEQINRHELQFERQSFENTFFNLLNYHKQLTAHGLDQKRTVAEVQERVQYAFDKGTYKLV